MSWRGVTMDNMASGSQTPAYRLRAATEADAAFVYQARVAGLKEYVARIWGWDEAYQTKRFAEHYSPARYQIVVVEGGDAGALSVENRTDEVFLADIELLPEFRGRGLGTAILGTIVADAEARGLPVTLPVLKVNPARRLYERLGFVLTGQSDTHYHMSTPRPGTAEQVPPVSVSRRAATPL
jgi:ribosomal protein S18 acetylase RimI-like enzyme